MKCNIQCQHSQHPSPIGHTEKNPMFGDRLAVYYSSNSTCERGTPRKLSSRSHRHWNISKEDHLPPKAGVRKKGSTGTQPRQRILIGYSMGNRGRDVVNAVHTSPSSKSIFVFLSPHFQWWVGRADRRPARCLPLRVRFCDD